MRRPIVVSCVLVLAGASAVPGALAKKPFNGNICGIPFGGELAAAHISDPCVKGKTRNHPAKRSPVGGSVGSTIYSAHWGQAHSSASPSHYLLIEITKYYGSGNALSLGRKLLFGEVLQNGYPIAVGNRASLATDTYSCAMNPPTGDCTKGEVLAIVGNYFVLVGLDDAPPTIAGAEEGPAEDEAQDNEQEETIKGPLTAIAKSIAAKL